MREVGIRVSLGAERAHIVRMLMSGGLKLVLIGAVLGLGAALLVAPVLASLLFGIRPMDVVAFTAMPLILGIVALAAAYIPARRASAVDPVRALRTE